MRAGIYSLLELSKKPQVGLRENLTSWVMLQNLEVKIGLGGGGGGGGRIRAQ